MKPVIFIVLFIVIVFGSIFAIEYYSRQTPSYTAQTEPIGPTGGITPGETVSTESATPMTTQSATTTPTPGRKSYTNPPAMSIDTSKTYVATLTTNKGVMKVALFAKEAPVTVNNFVFLATEKFYDDTVFHRIIKGFMIQGGDPMGNGMGNPGYKFNDEPVTRDYKRGTLAMANSGANTNGSQFFIMHADYGLPKNYVIFGQIDAEDSASLATLDAIATVPVGMSGSGEQSKPLEPVTLQSVTIESK